MRICREFENWRDLRALSGKFLRQKSCYPESFCFLRLCPRVGLIGDKITRLILILSMVMKLVAFQSYIAYPTQCIL